MWAEEDPVAAAAQQQRQRQQREEAAAAASGPVANQNEAFRRYGGVCWGWEKLDWKVGMGI